MYDFSFVPSILRAASQIMLSADRPENATHAKSGAQNFVTDYDIRTEQFLRTAFAEALPDWDMLGEESADSGQVVIAKDTTIGYLSQHQDISFDNTIYGEMLATKQYILDLEANIRRLEQDMKHAEG